ncbi:MAG TPA: hypothetical protein VGD52_04055, partial [Pseudoduganella sp.]
MTRKSNFTRILPTIERDHDLEHSVQLLYQRWWTEERSVADYIAHPLSKLSLIAEIYHFAPAFVEQQPRWQEISTNPLWQEALATPLRQLPISVYSVPAFYVDHLIKAGDGKFIGQCIDSGGIDSDEYFDKLVAMQHLSVDTRLAASERRPTWLNHFAGSRYAAVRLNVVRNPKAPADVLRLLYKDKDAKVAREAVDHPNFPSDALDDYAAHEEEKL